MANLLNERGYQMTSDELRSRLGLNPKAHLPDSLDPVDVDGTMVYIKPKTPGRFSIRTMAICSCGRHVPAGRIVQHRASHKEQSE